MPYEPTPLPTTDEATNQATASSEYTEQAGLYDAQNTQDLNMYNQQKTGIQQSYAQSRQNAINSYQDALDQINYGMRQVGITTRAGSASRGLYNASGELSGIGQNVASNAIEPLVRQTRVAGERQAMTMANLDANERQALNTVDTAIAGLGIKSQQQKLDLKNKIVQAIMDAAQKRQESEYGMYKDERNYNLDVAQFENQLQKDQANIPGTRENQLKIRSEEQAKGRTYIDDPKKLAAIARSGRHTITIGKDIFTLSDKEEADLRKIAAQTSKTLSGGASGSTSEYTGSYTNINGEVIKWIMDKNTGETRSYKVGDAGIKPTQGDEKLQADLQIRGEKLIRGDISPQDIEKAYNNGEIDAQVYQGIKDSIKQGLIELPVKNRKWYEKNWY